MKRNTKGVTLIEVLIVMSILAILSVMMAMLLDPIALMNKARDAQRKKDINRIKIAFEEYNNDKGCYPGGFLLDRLNSKVYCGRNIFSPWLTHWPCDPDGSTYMIVGDTMPDGTLADCSKTFKIITRLENKNDKDIAGGWYDYSTPIFISGLDGTTYTRQDLNYGVSSGNISWYDQTLPPECAGGCNVKGLMGGCDSGNGWPARCSDKDGNCYISNNCDPKCRVGCCFDGKLCQSLP